MARWPERLTHEGRALPPDIDGIGAVETNWRCRNGGANRRSSEHCLEFEIVH